MHITHVTETHITPIFSPGVASWPAHRCDVVLSGEGGADGNMGSLTRRTCCARRCLTIGNVTLDVSTHRTYARAPDVHDHRRRRRGCADRGSHWRFVLAAMSAAPICSSARSTSKGDDSRRPRALPQLQTFNRTKNGCRSGRATRRFVLWQRDCAGASTWATSVVQLGVQDERRRNLWRQCSRVQLTREVFRRDEAAQSGRSARAWACLPPRLEDDALAALASRAMVIDTRSQRSSRSDSFRHAESAAQREFRHLGRLADPYSVNLCDSR